ncbi:hypothetical protein RJ639_013408 [Escallonia herrerae]|uniref:Uncharacterized protein n=1 Tax=Escallonia herrerae TaxID=1293975 RepID=A0AA88VET4_9ASTE|nr:hypothetical protein RJ639_013408 [Escallonia herrerae]
MIKGFYITWPRPTVELAEFFSEMNKNLDLLNDYFPRDIGAYNSSTTPFVAVQVITFECGGVAVAVSSSHGIADGFTGCTFTSDWAAMSKLGTIKPLNYERSGFPVKDIDGIKPPRGGKISAKCVTEKFLFDGYVVSSLKAKVAPKFTGQEDKMELHDLVALVRDVEKTTTAECEKASNPDELFSLVFENLKEVREIMHDDNVDLYCLSSLCRFPLYKANFCWGKPCFVIGDSVPAEMVALKDTKCGTGI